MLDPTDIAKDLAELLVEVLRMPRLRDEQRLDMAEARDLIRNRLTALLQEVSQ